MKLYYDPISTTSRAVTFFLADQKIKIDDEVVSLFAEAHKTAEFKALNPNGQLPVLVDGDFVLTESSAILKYLADQAGSPAYPREAQARARINEAMDWFNTGFHMSYCVFLAYRYLLPELASLNAVTLNEIETLGQAKTQKYMDVLDSHMIGDRAFVCGDEISLADYLGATHVTLGEVRNFDLSPWPNVARWIASLKARPAWNAAYAGFNGMLSAARAA